MPAAPELETFARLIFPFDDPKCDQLYKCVSTIYPDRRNPANTKGIVANHAVQSYDDLISLIDSRRGWQRGNIFTALGLQRMANIDDQSNDGYAKAVRKGHNMVSFNCLFADIDVDPNKNEAYATPADADLGLEQFQKASGMPAPTMVVRSGGGGSHVYWCTDVPMPIDTWKPLAEALKVCAKQHGFRIDMAVTADAARVLRVPTTFNYKYGAPVRVTLDVAASSFAQYTVAGLTGVLSKYMTVQQVKTGSGTASTSSWGQNFTANAEQTLPRLSIDKIAVNCPMTAQTLSDGGAGKSEPDWSQDMYLAAWTDDPVDAAHRLSKGHSGYSQTGTDKKLAEKQAAIANGQLGWPKCESFNHSACKTCPLLQYKRSPIHFGHAAAAQQQPAQPKYGTDPLMPPEHWRNANDHVFTNGEYGPVDVLGYPILDGFIDGTTGELVLKTSISDKDRWGSLPVPKHTPGGVCEALYKGTRNGIVVKGNQTAAKTFIMAWITHLQTTKRTTAPHGFGWSGKNFVFGDEMYTPSGPESVYRGNTADENYQRVGDLQPWQDAVALAYGNAPMEIMVATAFAAPLVSLACDYSLSLSMYSHQSGYGKSTSMKIAQAVWGKPREGMAMLDDTANYMDKKSGNLKHLPLYWDEVKTDEQLEKLVRIIFQNAQGRSKGRLTRNSDFMNIGTSTTMLAIASNLSIASSIYRATEGTNAGGLRVFEVEAQPLGTAIPASSSEMLTIRLNENYGCAGALYADFIVRNRAAVEQIVKQISDDLDPVFNFKASERFWKNSMVTIIAGAMLANAAELTNFDVPAIQACLYESLRSLRMNLTSQSYTMAGANAGENVLAEMKAAIRDRNMVVTDTVPRATMGRPAIIVAHNTNLDRLGDVWMQVGLLDGRILIRVRAFNKWLREHGNLNPEQVIRALRKDYMIVPRRASIGAGVFDLRAVQNRSDCWDLTPMVAPSHSPASPSSSFGSP